MRKKRSPVDFDLPPVSTFEKGKSCSPGCIGHITKRCENCNRVMAGFLDEPIVKHPPTPPLSLDQFLWTHRYTGLEIDWDNGSRLCGDATALAIQTGKTFEFDLLCIDALLNQLVYQMARIITGSDLVGAGSRRPYTGIIIKASPPMIEDLVCYLILREFCHCLDLDDAGTCECKETREFNMLYYESMQTFPLNEVNCYARLGIAGFMVDFYIEPKRDMENIIKVIPFDPNLHRHARFSIEIKNVSLSPRLSFEINKDMFSMG